MSSPTLHSIVCVAGKWKQVIIKMMTQLLSKDQQIKRGARYVLLLEFVSIQQYTPV